MADENNECENCEVRDGCDLRKDDEKVQVMHAITIELNTNQTIGIRSTTLDVELLSKMLYAANVVINTGPADTTVNLH